MSESDTRIYHVIRRTLGILEGPKIAIPHGKELTCGICLKSFLTEETVSLACGHPFCCTCLTGYISTAINDGPGCLLRKCPEPSCPDVVGQDMVEKLAYKEDKERYHRYFLRSYIEDNRQMKWCPAPGCEHAIDYSAGTASYDVTCLCSHSFCWNAHSHVDCDTVERWTLEKNSASENINWILVNSKPCPKCKIPIEKNHGCVHMTCRPPCKYEFCWLCFGAWVNHSDSTGGFNDCILYETAKRNGLYDESEEKKKMAKKSLQRYLYYFEHWESNQTLRQRAFGDLQKMRLEKLAKLIDILRIPKSQLMFITKAWPQVIECRRVLKWTYSYGYYLRGRDKELFFEHLQGVAEKGLERLTKCVERHSEVFYNAGGPSDDFNHFKKKLTGLTR